MSGADNAYLTLTRRQIDAIRKVGSSGKSPTRFAPIAKDQLDPRNRTAQLMYKADGNPISSHPITAIAKCCPGLEFDFRAVWRRLLIGITLVEHDNLVVDTDDKFTHLKGHRLLKVNDHVLVAKLEGPNPSDPGKPTLLMTEGNPQGVICMEWSNSLASFVKMAGEEVTCTFSEKPWRPPEAWNEDGGPYVSEKLRIRNFFESDSAVISEELAEVGELTQGLCSPWQNDFRECSCYYWASSRPDYVNVEATADGTSTGDNWMQKKRTRDYVPDDYQDSRPILYDDLFGEWEKLLQFQLRGRDCEDLEVEREGLIQETT